ncbi:MAG: hypothetical protein JNM62_13800 [Flavobacteriales bacterium]|nr:hypothetical protein [Flavobacteriales bacterium]
MNRFYFILLCSSTVACTKQDELLPAHDASVPVHINEVFSAGSKKDDGGQGVGDWLELYNAGSPLELEQGAWFLTDDRSDLQKFELPAVRLAEQEHLRIWCDAAEGQGIHAPFRLSSKGEWLALVRLRAGRAAIIDSVRYAPRTRRHMSTSRYPDGAPTWVKTTVATPGSANAGSDRMASAGE